MSDYVFPVHPDDAHRAVKMDHLGDSGVDVGLPVGSKLVAVGDGTLVYAERGHTSWGISKAGRYAPFYGTDTPWSVRYELDKPVTVFDPSLGRNRTFRQVFMTHMRDVVPRAPGTRIRAGDVLGHSGLGRGVPHLHLSFYPTRTDNTALGGLADQDLIWGWPWAFEQAPPTTPVVIIERGQEDMQATGKTIKWIVLPGDRVHISNFNPNAQIEVDLKWHHADRSRRVKDWGGQDKHHRKIPKLDTVTLNPKDQTDEDDFQGIVVLKSSAVMVSRIERARQ